MVFADVGDIRGAVVIEDDCRRGSREKLFEGLLGLKVSCDKVGDVKAPALEALASDAVAAREVQ